MSETNVTIKTWPAFTAVGVKRRANGPDGLNGLWMNDFLPRVEEIPHKLESDEAYGLLRDFKNEDGGMSFDYLAAMPVSAVDELPAGMEAWAIPEGRYASVTVKFSEITKGFDIVSQWVDGSGEYEFNPEYPEIEYYPPNFDPEDPAATVDILTPIKAK